MTQVREFLKTLPVKLDADAAEGLDAIYQFDLSGPQGGKFYLIVRNGACSVEEGAHPRPQVVLIMSGEDCLGVLTGRLDGPSIFLSGRLRIEGDFGLALQLKSLFPSVG